MIVAQFINLERSLRLQADMVQGIQSKVLVRVLNREITTGRTAAVREIRKQVALKAGYVRDKLSIRRATQARLEASISAERRGILLTRFAHRQATRRGKPAGIRVTVKPGRSKVISGGFLLRLRAGERDGAGALGIAVRTTSARYPIKVLKGPSVEQVFRDTRAIVAPGMLLRTKSEVERQIAIEIKRIEAKP